MTFFGTDGPYASPFHDHPAPLAFDLLRAVVDAALIDAMADADVPQSCRLRLLARFNGRLLASELNPNSREAQ